jgi:hypothetical protein
VRAVYEVALLVAAYRVLYVYNQFQVEKEVGVIYFYRKTRIIYK